MAQTTTLTQMFWHGLGTDRCSRRWARGAGYARLSLGSTGRRDGVQGLQRCSSKIRPAAGAAGDARLRHDDVRGGL